MKIASQVYPPGIRISLVFCAVEKMLRGLEFIHFKTGFDQLVMVMVRRIGFTGWSRRGPGSIIDLERPVDEN